MNLKLYHFPSLLLDLQETYAAVKKMDAKVEILSLGRWIVFYFFIDFSYLIIRHYHLYSRNNNQIRTWHNQ